MKIFGTIYFSEDNYYDYFDYATSIREDLIEFVQREFGYRELLKRTYGKKTKKLLKKWFNKYGIETTRMNLYKILKKYTDNGMPKFG